MNKKITTSITLLVVIAIVFVLNYLVGGLGFGNFRWDVTEENLYTLSSGTKNILDRISPDKPVTIRYYATTDDRVLPPRSTPAAFAPTCTSAWPSCASRCRRCASGWRTCPPSRAACSARWAPAASRSPPSAPPSGWSA